MAKTSENRVPRRHRVPAHLARRFHQVCLGITAEVTERADLTPVEFAVIAALAEIPDTDQGSLAARLGIDAVSTHHLIHRLAAAGHVERRANPQDPRAPPRGPKAPARGVAEGPRARAGGPRESTRAPLAPPGS